MNKKTEPFRGGYFGMPLVLGPFDPGQKEHFLIWGSQKTVFVLEPEGLGFKYKGRRPLPPHPPDPAYAFLDSMPEAMRSKRDVTFFEVLRNNRGDVGFQLGEGGALFWVGSKVVQKQDREGWKPWLVFPKPFAERRDQRAGGVVVLPGGRAALIGGADFLIQVVEPKEDPKEEPKVLATLGYETLGTRNGSELSIRGAQFCVAGGHLFFYLQQFGRLFRLKLDSYSLSEYDVPWMYENPGETYPGSWKNGNTPDAPVLPESLAFAAGADGTVQVTALMFNLDSTTYYRFDLGQDGSTVHAEIESAVEDPDPLSFQNSKGNFVSLKTLTNND